MEKIGLLDEISEGVYNIHIGRKGLATEGAAEEGRISFTKGLLSVLAIFKEVYTNVTCDIETLILVELAYLTEELQYCNPTEKDVFASMTAGIIAFKDALRVLKTVQDAAAYKNVETSYCHLLKYRHKGMPKDAFHVACIAAYTRLHNTLRTPGINDIERQVYAHRLKNMIAAQEAYWGLQQKVLVPND
jgi:hypothetical protein